jgi:hypothetical protein
MNSSILGRARSTFEVNNTKRYAVEAKRPTVVRPSAEARKIKFRILAGLIAVCRFAAAQHPSSAGGLAEHHSDVEITWHILKPVELAAPDLRQLHVPDGHCHVTLEKSNVDVAAAISGRNDSGAFGLSRRQAAMVSRQVSNRFCRSAW